MDATIETLRFVLPAMIIPVGLVMLPLSLFVGPYVWKPILLLPFLYYLAIAYVIYGGIWRHQALE